jgi:protocatechuate 3,4-dioxygenase beta subunit
MKRVFLRLSLPLSLALGSASPAAPTKTAGTVLDGLVLDGTTSRPVAGAKVRVSEERAPTAETDTGGEATTDAKGRFRIEGLAPGRYKVAAGARGFGLGSRVTAVPAPAVQVFLFPGGWITGKVSGPARRPVAGALVSAEPDSPIPLRSAAPVKSDASGRFEIVGLREGLHRLVVRHPAFAPGGAPPVFVEKGVEARADVVLSVGVAVRGRIVNGMGEPLRGRVVVQELEGQPAPSAGDRLQAEAGADGRFRLDRLPPGSHVLAAVAPGYVAQQVPVGLDTRDRETDVGEVTLEAGFRIQGHVKDKAGRPVPAARVEAVQDRTAGIPMASLEPERSEGSTGADGSFVVTASSPGTYRITARASGFGAAVKRVEAGAEVVQLVLEPAGGIMGLVVDDRDRPVDGFQVSARPTRRDSSSSMRGLPVERQPDGRFLLRDVGEGPYALDVWAADRVPANVPNVVVAPGATTDVGRIRLIAGGTIRGSVVDSAGRAVAGARLRADGSRASAVYQAAPDVVTDTTGAFELRGIAPGAVVVTATHPGFAPKRATADVDPARGPAEVKIVLGKGARLEGSARRRDGAPAAGMLVQAGGSTPDSFASSSVTTRPDGSFVIDHVLAGRVRVTLMSPTSFGTLVGVHVKEIDVQEGDTAHVELLLRDVRVSGRVTRGGRPLAGARVVLQSRSSTPMSFIGSALRAPSAAAGPQPMSGVTRDDGGYDLYASEPGAHMVEVSSADGRTSYAPRAVHVPDAPSFSLPIDLGGTTLAGIVVDAQTEQPLPGAWVSASPKKAGGAPAPDARSGPDGRFSMDVDPGDYRLSVRAESHGTAEVEATDGVEVRIALPRGPAIVGRVLDVHGRGVGGLAVSARSQDGRHPSTVSETLPDGSFRLTGLARSAYNLFAGTKGAGFVVRTGVMPGEATVTLTLRPGGQVRLQVRGRDGKPLGGSDAWIQKVDGADVSASIQGPSTTDAQGFLQATLPSGAVELGVRKGALSASTTLHVPEGAILPAQVTLSEPPGR